MTGLGQSTDATESSSQAVGPVGPSWWARRTDGQRFAIVGSALVALTAIVMVATRGD